MARTLGEGLRHDIERPQLHQVSRNGDGNAGIKTDEQSEIHTGGGLLLQRHRTIARRSTDARACRIDVHARSGTRPKSLLGGHQGLARKLLRPIREFASFPSGDEASKRRPNVRRKRAPPPFESSDRCPMLGARETAPSPPLASNRNGLRDSNPILRLPLSVWWRSIAELGVQFRICREEHLCADGPCTSPFNIGGELLELWVPLESQLDSSFERQHLLAPRLLVAYEGNPTARSLVCES
ncbi:MAG TPA: hypothetical protein VGF45_07545 [Polyangia bacterium]